MPKLILLILIIFVFSSCGKSTEQKVADAILSATISLSKNDCQPAIDTLEGIGRQNKNARYLKTLASAYACRSGYNTSTFFASDFPDTATPAPLGGTATYSTSSGTFQVPLEYDPDFVDLQTAIDILLYAGGIASTTEPTATERTKYFSTSELGDLNSQLLYMQLVQLGRIIKVYGNASAVGVKGGGSFGNVCFSDYSNVNLANTVDEVLAALPGACTTMNAVGQGHSQIKSSVTAATRKRRMCHGVTLLNGFLDSLTAVISSASGDLSTVGTAAKAAADAAKLVLTGAYVGIGSVTSTMNQTLCEDNAIVPVAEIEAYYAIMFETMIQ